MKKIISIIFLSLLLLVLFLGKTEWDHFKKDSLIPPFNYGQGKPQQFSFYITKSLIKKIKLHFVNPEKDLSKIPNIHLYIDKKILKNEMYENLPKSGKERFYGPVFFGKDKNIPIEIKLRGDTDHHWRFEKKSYRIKTIDNQLLPNFSSNQLELISPKNYVVGDYVAAFLGNKLNLIVPDYSYVNLFLNGKFLGLYQASESIDNPNFLNKRNLPLGSIFEAENISFTQKPGIGNTVFRNPFIWENKIKHNQEDKHKELLTELMVAISNEDLETVYKLIDYDYFVRLVSLASIGQINHWDNRHNVKLYYNSQNQSFQQIPWDPSLLYAYVENGGKSIFVDNVSNDLMEILQRDPLFLQDKYKFIYENINNGLIEEIQTEILRLQNELQLSQKHDYLSFFKYKQLTSEVWNKKMNRLHEYFKIYEDNFLKEISEVNICVAEFDTDLHVNITNRSAYSLQKIILSDNTEIKTVIDKKQNHSVTLGDNYILFSARNPYRGELKPLNRQYIFSLKPHQIPKFIVVKNTITQKEHNISVSSFCTINEKKDLSFDPNETATYERN